MLFFHLPDRYLIGMGCWLLIGVVAFALLLKWRRARRAKGRPLRLIHSALTLWMVLAALTGAELYFALFHDTTDAFNQTNISRRWFTRHVDATRRALQFSDGEGLYYRETREVTHKVPDDRRRIVFLGDSFTFGHGINDIENRFSNRLGTQLEADAPGTWDVVNLAWAGTELHWASTVTGKLLADGFEMDTLVYVMCLNDIETFEDGPSQYADVGRYSPRNPLFADTYLLNLLYYRVQQQRIPKLRNYYGSITESYTGRPWQGMQALLKATRDACAEHDVNFVIVVFPFLHDLGPTDAFAPAHQVVTRFGVEAGIPVLDLRPVLLPHTAEGLTLNPLDAHPNERAHQLAADALHKFVREARDETVPETADNGAAAGRSEPSTPE